VRPPRFTPLLALERLRTFRKALPKGLRWLFDTGVPCLLVWVIVFVWTGAEAYASKVSGWEAAVGVSTGTTDPFQVHAGVAVALAILSTFLVPVLIGSVVGIVVEAQMRRMRQPPEKVEGDLERRVSVLESQRQIPPGTHGQDPSAR
jgi:TRAP-type C4-dicarboxylate transport system permease small subunit